MEDLLYLFAATIATPPRNETRSCDCGNDHEPDRDLNNEDVNHSVPPWFRPGRILSFAVRECELPPSHARFARPTDPRAPAHDLAGLTPCFSIRS